VFLLGGILHAVCIKAGWVSDSRQKQIYELEMVDTAVPPAARGPQTGIG
jgi:hypothetical protein